MKLLCRIGFHRWPRLHGEWREAVIAPSEAQCTRCQHGLKSVWRRQYPADGSRCKPGQCKIHRLPAPA